MAQIQISYRFQDGNTGNGSLTKEAYDFEVAENSCRGRAFMEFISMTDADFSHRDGVECSASYRLGEENMRTLGFALDAIRNNQAFTCDDFGREAFNPEKFSPVNVVIDGASFELPGNSGELNKLAEVLRLEDFRKVLESAKEKSLDLFGELDILED